MEGLDDRIGGAKTRFEGIVVGYYLLYERLHLFANYAAHEGF